MTGFKWAYYPPMIWNVIQQRCGGVCSTLHNSVIVPHEKGGRKPPSCLLDRPTYAADCALRSRDSRRGASRSKRYLASTNDFYFFGFNASGTLFSTSV